MGPDQQALFPAPLAGFVANVSWRPGQGWRVCVTSWHQAQAPASAPQDAYSHLTLDEALDVLAAGAYSRCEWLRG